MLENSPETAIEAEEKEWKIPVSWVMIGTVTVKAQTLEDAIEVVQIDESPLPDGDYLLDSFEVVYADNPEEIRSLYNGGQPDAGQQPNG